jgi:enoyl-CoA hydratase
MGAEHDIRFERRGPLGVVTLDRSRALNAITLEMFERFEPQLAAWAADPDVRAVAIRGAGERAFCAGGDIRTLYEGGLRGERVASELFRVEYRLNRRIKTLPKPYVALIDGIVMGGGVGVSVHGSHRVVTERTVFAMPETGIGFFPDVGGSFFLPRMPGALGMYLGLTGARLKAADCLYAGVGTYYVESVRLADLEAALAEADWVADPADSVANQAIGRIAGDPGAPPLAEHRAAIDRCFSGDAVEAILAALAAEGGAWADKTLATLRRASPTSLKVTFEQLRRGAALDFDAAMVMEYRLSQAFMAGHDFYEGIRAVVIDKDNAPAWEPASLEAVTPALVEAHFAPPAAGDLTFE